MATADSVLPESFILHSTPSRQDGISFEQELTYRQNCCQLILDIAEGFRQTPSEPSVQLCAPHAPLYVLARLRKAKGCLQLRSSRALAQSLRCCDHVLYT